MDVKHVTHALQISALNEAGRFSGYASVFGQVDDHKELVMKGAFTRTLQQWRLAGRMPAMLWMHDPSQPVGVWHSIAEDEHGLAVQGQLALRTQKGGEAHELLKIGALTGLSIGYRVVSSQLDAKKKVKRLTEVELFEISLVTFPANDGARVQRVKSPRTQKTQDAALRAAALRLNEAARILKS